MKQRLYEDLSVFFAYAVSLELESSERLRQLAVAMTQHHHYELADLFSELARNSELHGAEVESLSDQLCIPNLRSWDYALPESESVETVELADINFAVSPEVALATALRVEHKAEHFYRDVAQNSEDQQIINYASQFAAEELKHITVVEQKMDDLSELKNSR